MNGKILSLVLVAIVSVNFVSPAEADGSWYLGGAGGNSSIDGDIGGVNVDDSTALRFFGGYRFSDHFGLEVAYLDLGSFDANGSGTSLSGSAEADGFQLAVLGVVPIGERFAVEARAGMFFWDGNARFGGSSVDPSDKNAFLAVGGSYAISQRIDLTADWTRLELANVEVDMISIGFRVRLGR